MTKDYRIRRIWTQGTSFVVAIPKQLREELDLHEDDFIRLDKVTKIKQVFKEIKEQSKQKKLQ